MMCKVTYNLIESKQISEKIFILSAFCLIHQFLDAPEVGY